MVLKLWQIKVKASPLIPQPFGIVEEVQGKIENASRNWLTIDQHMLFHKMPAARTNQQRRRLFLQCVFFAFRAGILNSAVDCVSQVNVTLYSTFPHRGKRVFKVGHE